MTIAVRFALEDVGAIYSIKSGHDLLEGDIEFACSIFPDKTSIFIVDNAADHGEELSAIIDRLSNLGQRALFLLGERLNEWRQVRTKPIAHEFGLEPLSDPEIKRVLNYLAERGMLNALEHLDHDMQFAAIKERHKKELLVVLREATEGTSFDAILEGEFRGIGSTFAQKLYLTVCCFHQHGAYCRSSLLANLLGISETELHSRTGNETEGVVVYEAINEAQGIFAARARHRTIAAVVWERCGDPAEQETILQEALEHLNLNYRVDKDAFDDFVRSDRLIDNSISTLDGKIRFLIPLVEKTHVVHMFASITRECYIEQNKMS